MYNDLTYIIIDYIMSVQCHYIKSFKFDFILDKVCVYQDKIYILNITHHNNIFVIDL